MMRLAEVDIRPYEGLVFSTARRYSEYLDLDMEDVQQILRLKVAQALMKFDPGRRSTRFELAEARRRWVFGAVRNQVKDLLKAQDRRNDARGGGQLYIEDVSGETDAFERRHLMESDEDALAPVLDQIPELPSSLNWLERGVVLLLILELNQTEIARRLGVSRQKVRTAHASVQVKMADWRPPSVADRPLLAA
jgi:RNA polymerase sigma factor (sigma-70 family)